jgi:hypothetical protein
MFIFCNNKKSQDIMKFLKKIYKVNNVTLKK